MRRHLRLWFMIVVGAPFWASFAHLPICAADSEPAVQQVLARYAAALEKGELSAIEKLWAQDETLTVFENGYANYGWADYRDHHLGPELGEMKNTKFVISDVRVKAADKTAWATFKYSIAADLKERHVEGAGLGTAVLELRSDGWRIVHWHTSSPRRPPAPPAKN